MTLYDTEKSGKVLLGPHFAPILLPFQTSGRATIEVNHVPRKSALLASRGRSARGVVRAGSRFTPPKAGSSEPRAGSRRTAQPPCRCRARCRPSIFCPSPPPERAVRARHGLPTSPLLSLRL